MKKIVIDYVTNDIRKLLLEVVGTDNEQMSNVELERAYLFKMMGESLPKLDTQTLWRRYILNSFEGMSVTDITVHCCRRLQ